jgi:hypothetical protein
MKSLGCLTSAQAVDIPTGGKNTPIWQCGNEIKAAPRIVSQA